jgi:hypothetical protein
MKYVIAASLAVVALAGCGGASSTTESSSSSTSPASSSTTVSSSVGASQTVTASGPATSTTAPKRAASGSGRQSSSCPNPSFTLVGVYHPGRLHVIDSCRHVTGSVISTSGEQDGDLHFDVRLDAPYTAMLMSNNHTEQHGALVVELMPRDHGHLPAPSVGDRVSITGAYVDDTQHDWAEIHPVWDLSINGGPISRSGPQYGGSPPSASSESAIATCQTKAGAPCADYGTGTSKGPGDHESATGSAPPQSQPSGSRSSGSETVVQPGAFCSPEGAHGVTDRGRPMTCRPSAKDSRDRWRRSS